jgi:branched-chain amino acid transport system permease protein
LDTVQTIVQFVINALSLGGQYALMALGLSLIYGILNLVNFAYGELVMIGGYTLYLLGTLAFPEISWIPVALAAVAMATVFSLILERVAFRPVRNSNDNIMLVTSFAVSTFLQNGVILFISGRTRPVRTPAFFSETTQIGPFLVSISDFTGFLISFVLLGLLMLFMRRTILGNALRAASTDFTMTRLLGIRANEIIALAFAISGCLAGVVSLFWIGQFGSVTPDIGLIPVIFAFVGSVVGGLGSLEGAVLGGYLLGFVNVALFTFLPLDILKFQRVFLFGFVILVLVFRPQGLIGRTTTEKI